MPFDNSGTYSRVDTGATTWRDDAAAGTKIRADLHDNHDNDIASGLSECLTKTGKSLPTVDINWGGKRITNLANPDPTSPQDAATKFYVDNISEFSTAKNVTGADSAGR